LKGSEEEEILDLFGGIEVPATNGAIRMTGKESVVIMTDTDSITCR
jgi:hypothetical protein